MHIHLEKALKKFLGKRFRIHTAHVIAPAAMEMKGESFPCAPGDLLTIHYILHRKKNSNYETLLAARSLIYVKLLVTEEMLPSKHEKTPHLKDEGKVYGLVNGLSQEQCEYLFRKIRFQNRRKALDTVSHYLSPALYHS